MTKYILYCSQESNFQTRSMLIPYDLIMKCPSRIADLEILRSHSMKNVKFNHDKPQALIVDNLLIQNYTFTGNCGKQDKNPYREIINNFTGYADGNTLWDWGDNPEIGVYKEEDRIWINDAICGLASEGFNHVTNYCNFRNRTEYKGQQIEIVEGFLVLESDNGILNESPVDSVEELFAKFYPDNLEAYRESRKNIINE